MNVTRFTALAAISCLVPLAAAAEAPATANAGDTAAPVVMAVWVEKKIYFPYMGITSHYSCDGLRDKVSRILTAIGARPGFEVKAGGCAHTNGPERLPNLRIVAAMPQAATPELLEDLAKGATQRELAAKAGGKAAPVAEAGAEFATRTRRIDFRDSTVGLVQAGDCELIEQMRDKVFVPLGAKIIVNDMDCIPHTIYVGTINLSLDVLEPVPTA